MNAQVGQVVALTSRQLLWRDITVAAVTIAAILAWSYAVVTLAAPVNTPDEQLERTMLAACRLPDKEGSATLFLRFLGKGFCWRFQ